MENEFNNSTRAELVLVTGGSGFVGAHCIVQLLEAGYRVRTTVRSLKREADVRAMVKAAGQEADGRLTFIAADLTADMGWTDAVAGCAYVLHVASPFPDIEPKNENDLIIPAREGALRVLRAARSAGVKRVVLTSSFAAVGYGVKDSDIVFNEEHWSNPEGPGMRAYLKSKTLAERAAWDFIHREGGSLELAVIAPVAIFGPALGSDYATSIQLIHGMLTGAMPGIPRLSFGVVDVRDVAYLHLRAMTSAEAKGQRFLAVAGEPVSLHDIAMLLRAHLGEAADKVPTKELPDWKVRLGALFNAGARQMTSQLGKVKRISNDKARRMLHWTPRSNEEAILAAALSLLPSIKANNGAKV